MDAFGLVFDGAMRAAVRLLVSRKSEIDADLLSQVGKSVLNRSIDRLLEEWRGLVDANLSEAWLQESVNAQAVELGTQIADAYHTEIVWSS